MVIGPPSAPADDEPADREGADAEPGRIGRLLAHRVVVTGLLLVVLQLALKGAVSWHSYLWQEDLHYIARSYHQGLSAHTVFFVTSGHLYPVVSVVSGILTHLAPFDYTPMVVMILVVQAAAALAVLRMLVTLFGERPAILFPFVLYLATPLTIQGLAWWSSGLETLPFQIAFPMALACHVRFVRDGRFRHVIAASLWFAFGLACYLKSFAIPLLAFVVTWAYLTDAGWLRAVPATLRRYWRAWCAYAAVLAGYAAVYITAPHVHHTKFSTHQDAGKLVSAGWDMIREMLVPGALGGPWKWVPDGGGADPHAWPPIGLAWASWIIGAAAVVLTCRYRRRSAWAWGTLLGYVILVDMLPTAIGRVQMVELIGTETRYIGDAAPLIALCVALAFLPVSGERDPYRPGVPSGPAVRRAGIVVVAAAVVGSVWSVTNFNELNDGPKRRTFMTNVTGALRQAPPGTIIADRDFPTFMATGLFGDYAEMGFVLQPYLAKLRRPPAFTADPHGTIDHLMAFDDRGRLRGATVSGVSSKPLPPGHCHARGARAVTVHLRKRTSRWKWVIRIGYLSGRSRTATVTFGGRSYPLHIEKGLHTGYVTVPVGAGRTVRITAPHRRLCVALVTVGTPVADPKTPALPKGGA